MNNNLDIGFEGGMGNGEQHPTFGDTLSKKKKTPIEYRYWE